jgi:hypothetical protein
LRRLFAQRLDRLAHLLVVALAEDPRGAGGRQVSHRVVDLAEQLQRLVVGGVGVHVRPQPLARLPRPPGGQVLPRTAERLRHQARNVSLAPDGRHLEDATVLMEAMGERARTPA